MSTVAYKCPNCASPLTYDGKTGQMVCNACDSLFDLETIEALNETMEEGVVDFEAPTATFDEGESAQMQAYHCKSCGAELITEGTTTATECPYCGSPTVLPDRIDGGIRPEKVVPFLISKEEAQKSFVDYFKGKLLLPNIFKKDNHIAEIRKLFVPYWLFDCDAEGNIMYDAEKRSTHREGNYEVTTVEHYLVRRAGNMHFENIPVDGSEKMDNKITESLEPYDLSQAVAFAPTVLSGAMADHADVDAVECETRAIVRVENSVSEALRKTVMGYSNVRERVRRIHSTGGKVTPVLMPVWLITTKKDDKTYTFAINGQTGKLTCNVPTAKGKAALWGIGTWLAAFGIGAGVCKLLDAMEGGPLLGAALVALVAAGGVLAALLGQLKQAAMQQTASGYSEGCDLTVRYDKYLYKTTTRRKIETQSKSASA